MRLAGKYAFVTGGGQGIGRGIVEAFRSEGAQVWACGRGTRPEDLPDTCGWVTLDVTDTKAVDRLANGVAQPLDILVNNAAVHIEKTVTKSTETDWETVIGVNCKGVFNMCRAFIPHMAIGGSVINIGSASGSVAEPSQALFNASKAFVHGLTRSIAVDHGPGIRCNAICPGWIQTGMREARFKFARDPVAARTDTLARHPAGRLGDPKDVAAMAVWLASAEAEFVTGQCFTMDGGLTAMSPLGLDGL